MKRKDIVIAALAAVSLCAALDGCSSESSNKNSSGKTEAVNITDNEKLLQKTENDTSGGDTSNRNDTEKESSVEKVETTENDASVLAMASGLFSDRDFKLDYNESDAEKIALNGSSITCSSNKVLTDGAAATIKAEGIYILTGSLDDGMIIVDVSDTEKVQLILDNVDINKDSSAAIYVKEAHKVFITTLEGTVNHLSGGVEYVNIDDNNIDATIFSKGDITLNGLGTLDVTSKKGHGICSKDDITVTGGSYVINAGKHGLSGKDSVDIAGGDFEISCSEDGIHSENDDNAEKGNINIYGGKITINAGDDGMHAGNTLTVAYGNIDIQNSYEGLEGLKVHVSGGDVNIVANDDGINAAGSADDENDFGGGWGHMGGGMDTNSDANVTISGGNLHIDANGDGLDSNGYLTVSGGEIYVDGPTNNGNGALDYGLGATITGGTIVAVGASGMAEGFTTVENQGAILTTVNNASAGSEVILLDSSGKELFRWTAGKSFNSVVLSTPDIIAGETYTLKTGDSEVEITMDSLNYQNGSAGGFGKPNGQGGFDGPGGHGGFGEPGGHGGHGDFPNQNPNDF